MAQPTPVSGRFESMDVLRGFALLGILLLNIHMFGLPLGEVESPGLYGGSGTLDMVVYWVTSVFGAGKFMSLFSLLFGAGVALMVDSRRQRGVPSAGLHYKRMTTLAVLGIVHGLFIWFGDILLPYAIAGAILYPLLLLSSRALLWCCLGAWLLFVVCSLGFGGFVAWLNTLGESSANAGGSVFADEIERMRGGWLDVAIVRLVHWLIFMVLMPFLAIPWVLALMLTGVLAKRGGWLTAERSSTDYVLLLIAGVVIGLTLAGLRLGFAFAGPVELDTLFSFTINGFDAFAFASAYAAGVMLIVKAKALCLIRHCLAAVGRMALTNYLAQSLICTTLFNGYGLGLFGYLSYLQLLLVVVGVWILQLVWSPLYLSRFERGPMEAIWRRLTYGSARSAAAAPPAE